MAAPAETADAPVRGDSAGEWKRHLREPGPDATTVTLAGCKAEAPATPRSFWQAVEVGDVAHVAQLLEAGEPVDQIGGPYGSTALGWAALAGDVALARVCLEHKAKVEAKSKKGSAPLHLATWNGDHDEIVRLLLDAGADPLSTNAAGLTPLAQARWFERLETESSVDSLFEMGAWREQWARPAPGRARVIARLAAATGESLSPTSGAEPARGDSPAGSGDGAP